MLRGARPLAFAVRPIASLRSPWALQVADVPDDTFQREEKRRLKELSDTRAAGWPNTLSVGVQQDREDLDCEQSWPNAPR